MSEEMTAEADVEEATTEETIEETSEKASEETTETEEKAEDPKGDAESEAESEEKKPKVDPVQRKIAKQAYELREAKRREERLLSMLEKQQQAQPAKAPPKLDDFDSVEDYLDARDEYRAQDTSELPDTDTSAYDNVVQERMDDLFLAGNEKYDGFEDLVRGDDVRITPAMRDTILEMDELDTQVEVAKHLAENPTKALSISKMSPLRQAMELGKLETAISAKPKPKKPSAAPKPIKPVGGAKTDSNEITGDEDMATFIRKRNKQKGRPVK